MPINGPAIGVVAIGSLFMYSAIKGKSILATAQAIILGQSPKSVKQSNSITTPADTSSIGAIGVNPSGLPSSGTFNHTQLMQLWQQMGGTAATANNAACHAIQESSGDPLVTSSNPDGGTNVGLWQLDTNGVGKGYTVQELQNAQNNCRITIAATSGGTDWSQWATPGC